jgi:hypothetical protein
MGSGMSIDLYYTMTKVIAPVPIVFFHRKQYKGVSQDVFFLSIGRARVSLVVPHLYGLPSLCFGDIRLSRLLLINPESPHEILACDIEVINQVINQ